MPDDATRRAIESWFRTHGVPQFAHRHSGADRNPDLLLLLCVVFAFELGVAPWMDLSAGSLVLAQASLIAVTFVLLPLLRVPFGLAGLPSLPWWEWLLRGALVAGAAVLLATSDLPPLLTDPWINFALMMVAFAACSVLFSPHSWSRREPEIERLHRALVAALSGAILLFALEGSAIDTFDATLTTLAANVDTSLTPVPQGIPPLLAVTAVLRVTVLPLMAVIFASVPPTRTYEPAERYDEEATVMVVDAVAFADSVVSG